MRLHGENPPASRVTTEMAVTHCSGRDLHIYLDGLGRVEA
jgi:hypothetical protein